MRDNLKVILPKGRIQARVLDLLGRIGMPFAADDRSLRSTCGREGVEAKFLKPQNVPQLVALGRHDCGFTGRDWIVEQGSEVVELLDLGFDPVRLVAAAPESVTAADLRSRRIVVASEYANIAGRYIEDMGLDAVFIRSFGATEALPPEDADLIVDNTASGSTLRQNRLAVVDEIMRSTTRFVANSAALGNPFKRKMLDEMTMLMKSTLCARERVLLEMNVPADRFDAVVEGLPCMKSPTIAKLYNEAGFAVKVAVPSCDVPSLVPRLIALGATDILEYKLEKIVVNGK